MLYNNVKEIAKSKGVPIYKIEEDLNFSSGSICKWNEIKPSYDKVVAVSNYLGVLVEDLVKPIDKNEGVIV